MDPDVALDDILTTARTIIDADDDKAPPPSWEATVAMAQQILDLSAWLTRGGFLPAPWRPQ